METMNNWDIIWMDSNTQLRAGNIIYQKKKGGRIWQLLKLLKF